MSQTPADASCVFCRIVAGTIPCHRLAQTPHTLAFLDIMPLSRGHCLVIPKGHWELLDQMPPEVAGACGAELARVASALREATGCAGWNVLQNNGEVAGQVVKHVHFHLIPRQAGDGLGYRWPAGKLSEADAVELRQAMGSRLG
jgi:histidine triad (HIT) family protein